jgi:hypothetical protein
VQHATVQLLDSILHRAGDSFVNHPRPADELIVLTIIRKADRL